VGAWWSFLVVGPLGPPVLLAYSWRDRGSVAQVHATCATVVDFVVVACVLPLLDQLSRGLDATSRLQVEQGVATSPQNVFDHTTRTAWILAVAGLAIGLSCTLAGTVVAVLTTSGDPAGTQPT
jgi:hypothetical protein